MTHLVDTALRVLGERDEALGLLRELRANHRRPFGGWAPYDLPTRVDEFLDRVDPPSTAETAA